MDNDGNAWCLEVNTLPGMTPNSLIPKAAKLEGLDYPHLCELIVKEPLINNVKDYVCFWLSVKAKSWAQIFPKETMIKSLRAT